MTGGGVGGFAPADHRMSITASGMSWAPGRKTQLCCQGKAALPESDPELTAMLSRAAESVRLQWKALLSPERSRLDDWYPGVPHAVHQCPSPVPFFMKVHE